MNRTSTEGHLVAPPIDTAVLVAVDVSGSGQGGPSLWSVEDSIEELSRLVDTAGASVVGTLQQRMSSPVPATFIGSGKVEELKNLAQATGASVVVFDDELSPRQQFNLEKELGGNIRVADRTAIILDIFAQHARTREGKLQVELATYEYELPRLRGMWSHLEKEKLGGGVGARFGMGESQLETDRRLARKRIALLKRELERVSAERDTQRRERIESGTLRVALVGYTNAGKSSLLRALTGADVLVYDQLFATLDSTTRRLTLPAGREVTLTDTVGFINKLPHQLVAAFKSTLAEVVDADLLLHVVDASSPLVREHIAAVESVLAEIGAERIPRILVWNKADLAADGDYLASLTRTHEHSVVTSAETGDGLPQLLSQIEDFANSRERLVHAVVPYTRGDLLELVHSKGTVQSLSHVEAGTEITAYLPERFASRFDDFAASSSSQALEADSE